MSEPEKFLQRWMRRKQEATEEKNAETGPVDVAAQPTAREREPNTPAFDPTTLPPIESITAETDIRAFLAPDVPSELTLAALRRAWVADPKIRDFVGLADYDWDFNAPGSASGFGPLDLTDDIRRQVVRMLSGEREPVRPSRDEDPVAGMSEPARAVSPPPARLSHAMDAAYREPAAAPDELSQASEVAPAEDAPQPTGRHGSALPR